MRVRAITSGVVSVDHGPAGVHKFSVVEGREYDSKELVVKQHKTMFERVGVPVEQATAAPGEKRDTKRV